MVFFPHVSFEDLPIDVVAIRAVARPEVLFDGDQRPRGHEFTVSRAQALWRVNREMPRLGLIVHRDRHMPYEISFTKHVPIVNRDQYINECCIGGDVVVGQLLASVQAGYDDVQTNQEDWGWFIWFRKGKVRLAIDIFTDDPGEGAFRVHLTSRTKRWWLLNSVIDTPELEELRVQVTSKLAAWVGSAVKVVRLDDNDAEVS